MANEIAFLVTPAIDVKSFLHAEDRAYFAKPVPVIVHGCDPLGHWWVTDPRRDVNYPVDGRNLKRLYQLTRKQVEAVT